MLPPLDDEGNTREIPPLTWRVAREASRGGGIVGELRPTPTRAASRRDLPAKGGVITRYEKKRRP